MNENTVELLLADDSETMRRAICASLQGQTGVEVCGEVGNYVDLLKMLNESKPHVVLMDLRMPGGDQCDPATIKDHLHGSWLLAMSVWNDQETANLALTYGAVKLLDKSQLACTLIPAIEECIQQNRTAHHA